VAVETVLLYILGVVIIVVGVALSIGLHEIGHLIPAKLFGVKVGQWMIGFGPTLFKKKFGETEYGVKAIPLGGYISMAGMFPPGKVKNRAIDRAGHLRDELELEFVEGDLHDAAEDAALRRTGSTVDAVRSGRPKMDTTGFFNVLVQDARDSSAETITPGDEDRVFYKLAFWKRIIIMLGGPAMNLLLAVVFYGVVICLVGSPGYSTTISEVSQCMAQTTSQTAANKTCAASDPATPAAAGGLKPGDTVLSIDGTAISSYEQETAIIRSSIGKPLAFVVDRDGSQKTLTVTPTRNATTDATGATVQAGFIGIVTQQKLVTQPVTAVLPAVGANITHTGGIILDLPHRLAQVAQAAFGGQKRDPNGPISVVGVGRIAGTVASTQALPVADRASAMLQIIASLNVALFVFNLIPLLPLDGGHVIGALWEAIRRRFAKWFKRPDPGPVDMAKLIPLTLAVSGVLGLMSVLLIYADIVNPIVS
jgi:membrane-associated protease RseP (regulator of RpoE activity)